MSFKTNYTLTKTKIYYILTKLKLVLFFYKISVKQNILSKIQSLSKTNDTMPVVYERQFHFP